MLLGVTNRELRSNSRLLCEATRVNFYFLLLCIFFFYRAICESAFFFFVLLPFSLYFFSSALLVEEITVEVLTQQKMSKHGRFFFPFNVVVVNAFIEK